MADLIDRKALLKKAGWVNLYGGNKSAHVVYSKDIHEAPAVDAVEVVRCGECEHWNEDALACDGLPWVDSSEHANWYAEDFCSYGERGGVRCLICART